MTELCAQIAAIGRTIYIYPLHTGMYGVRYVGMPDSFEVLSARDLGIRLLLSLRESDDSNHVLQDESSGARDLLHKSGYKTWAAFARKAQFVWADLNREKNQVILKPMIKVRGGSETRLDQSVIFNAADTENIGSEALRMLGL